MASILSRPQCVNHLTDWINMWSSTWTKSLKIGIYPAAISRNMPSWLLHTPKRLYLYASARCKQPSGQSFLSVIGSLLCWVSDTIRLVTIRIWRMDRGRCGKNARHSGAWRSCLCDYHGIRGPLMTAISPTIFSDVFSRMKSCVLELKCHISLFLRVQLIIIQHWFR